MVWKHHYSLIASAVVTAILLATRADFDPSFLVPHVILWPGGHTLIIYFGRRKKSPQMEALEERLEMEAKERKHRNRMTYDWSTRHFGLLVLFGAGGFLALVWLGTYGIDGVKEWLELFGCSC